MEGGTGGVTFWHAQACTRVRAHMYTCLHMCMHTPTQTFNSCTPPNTQTHSVTREGGQCWIRNMVVEAEWQWQILGLGWGDTENLVAASWIQSE